MNARAALRALAVASVIGLSCSDPAEPPLPAFSVSPAAQWSGGSITLRSSYFANRSQAPIVVVDGDTLTLIAVDDSTATTVLPQGPSGPVVFALMRGTREDSLGTVPRVGYREMRTQTGPGFQGVLEASDSAGVPVVFGAVDTSVNGRRAPIVRLKVASAQSSQLVPTLRQPDHALYGMAPSFTPGTFVVWDSTDTLRMAQLIGDVPVITDIPVVKSITPRQVAQLSDNIWMLTGSHLTQTRQDSTTTITIVPSESPYRVFMSPRGDRTTLATVVSGVDGGVPVFDNLTGTLAYRLPFWDIRAAAFSPDGALMYVAGGSQYHPDSVAAVDAATGAVQIGPLKLPNDFFATGMAYRPTDNQVLVGATSSANGIRTTLYLLVYRASTLELLGVLPSAYECGEAGAKEECVDGAITVHDAADRAYIVITGSPIRIMTFDLLGNL